MSRLFAWKFAVKSLFFQATCAGVSAGSLFCLFSGRVKNKEPVAKPALAFPAAPTAVNIRVKTEDLTILHAFPFGFLQKPKRQGVRRSLAFLC